MIICWNEQGLGSAASSPEQWHEEEEEEEEVCVCVCVCVVCWSKQQAAHGATDMVLFTLSPVTSTHATHTTNFVCTFLLTQGIITEWQWITWLTCVLCAPKWIYFYFILVTNFAGLFSNQKFIGGKFWIYKVFKIKFE